MSRFYYFKRTLYGLQLFLNHCAMLQTDKNILNPTYPINWERVAYFFLNLGATKGQRNNFFVVVVLTCYLSHGEGSRSNVECGKQRGG